MQADRLQGYTPRRWWGADSSTRQINTLGGERQPWLAGGVSDAAGGRRSGALVTDTEIAWSSTEEILQQLLMCWLVRLWTGCRTAARLKRFRHWVSAGRIRSPSLPDR